jgi:hypothetical protein
MFLPGAGRENRSCAQNMLLCFYLGQTSCYRVFAWDRHLQIEKTGAELGIRCCVFTWARHRVIVFLPGPDILCYRVFTWARHHVIVFLPGPDISKQRKQKLRTEDIQQKRKHTHHLEEQSDPRHKGQNVCVCNVVQQILNSKKNVAFNIQKISCQYNAYKHYDREV